MGNEKKKDRIMKFDEKELLIQGILLKVEHDLKGIEEILKIALLTLLDLP
jgi:hypothetical protein